jgi:NAD(P)-dependent dehydrogenase (short-subunit alcohol dehydrogenase family)
MTAGRFDGKVALVTGATSGIGRAAALALAAEGAKVALVGRRREALDDLAAGIEADGRTAQVHSADVLKEEDRQRVVVETAQRFGGLDVLVQAAGIIGFGTIENTSLSAWQEMFEINVVAVYRLLQHALAHLLPRRGNAVIVSSVTGLRSFPGVLAYCASKAAVDQLVRCAALELAERGVRVNAVNPGVVVSELHRRAGMSDDAYQAFLERSKTTHPLRRVGTPQEVADLILFLASDGASWLTGATIPVDGGRHLTCAR